MPSTDLLFSMTAWSFSLPTLARCERPRAAPESAARLQPGRLAHGPEENWGRTGLVAGFVDIGSSRFAREEWFGRIRGRGARRGRRPADLAAAPEKATRF